MRGLTLVALVGLVGLVVSARAEDARPLAAPKAPKAEVRGKPGTRTICYWAYATDARGHSAYSNPTVVNNAPDALSADNAVVLTPAPVEGAAEYAILTSRCQAPREVKVEVGAKGGRTFYYWFQARNGRTVWSPVEGPIKVEGCADQPDNKLTWAAAGAEFTFIYRTETPEPPLGVRNCLIGGGLQGTSATDKMPWPAFCVITPAGNPSEAPEGLGAYLVGTSKGEPITDEGQPLKPVTAYNMNTTDPAYRHFKPEVKGYVPGGDQGAYQFDFTNRTNSPKYSWDHFEGLSVHQTNVAGGLNEYPRDGGWSEMAKNSHIAIGFHQMNYTSSQKAGILGYVHNYGNGDCVGQVFSLNTTGQNRAGGDEGTEFCSYHLARTLTVSMATVSVDTKRGDIFLPMTPGVGMIADRGIVNLSQAYRAGAARVEGDRRYENGPRTWKPFVVGAGTQWTPQMEGWYISFDADTRPDGIRQWYRVERVLSPTRLEIFACTYWSSECYLGSAHADGPYLLCPYTEMKEGPGGAGTRVAPLPTDWKKGDQLELMAGPQTTCRLGWWEIQGKFLPQDHIGGLGIIYGGDKDPGEGALNILGRWPSAVEVHGTKYGMFLENVSVGMVLSPNCPVVLRTVGANETPLHQLAQDDEGLYLESMKDAKAQRTVGLTLDGIKLYQGGIAGNERTRGSAAFSGDGKTTEFAVKFPAAHTAAPFVVASSNQRIGMGVERVAPDGFTAGFAAPPPAGKDNVVVTWMVQE